MATYTLNKFFDKPTPGTEAGAWGSSLNNYTFDIMDKALGGIGPISVSSSNYNLSTSEAQNAILYITGTLTADLNIVIPYNYLNSAAIAGSWIIFNATTGAFNITLKTVVTGSQGVVVPQSSNSIVFSDGTNVSFADNRVSQAATGGGSDQVFFLNDQIITTSYTVPTSKNAMSAGPIQIQSGATVTINPPTVWTIV
jgi:hypothetical protein